MQGRWYPPGSLHHFVFEFLRRYCQNPDNLVEFARQYQKKHTNDKSELTAVGAGLVSKQQLLSYFFEISGGGGVSVGNVLARIYDSLVYWDVFTEFPLSKNLIYDLQINFMNVNMYESSGVLENIVKGPGILAHKYRPAVAAIIVERGRQESIGSGSIVGHNGKTFILTNKHVVNPNDGLTVKDVILAGKSYASSAKNILLSKTDDLAAFQISVPNEYPKFFLGPPAYILQEVILLGFPKIPFTNGLQLTAHSGEVNAVIETRNGDEFYLISNYAAPGSSGGPLIDYRGLLMGVVSDSLEAKYEESIFQHTAAVTHDRVLRFVQGDVGAWLI